MILETIQKKYETRTSTYIGSTLAFSGDPFLKPMLRLVAPKKVWEAMYSGQVLVCNTQREGRLRYRESCLRMAASCSKSQVVGAPDKNEGLQLVSIHRSIYLYIYLSVHPSISLSTYLS